MSLLRIFNGANCHRWQLKQKIKYLSEPPHAVEEFFSGAGVGIETVFEEFLAVQKAHMFPGTKLFFHWLISFDEGSVTPELASEVAKEINGFFKGRFQIIQGVHVSGRLPTHVHTIANSVSPITGEKLYLRKAELMAFKIHANEVLKKYGLNEINMWLPEEQNKIDGGY